MALSSNNKRKAGALIFAGGAQFAILLIVAESVYPGYSVADNYISDLGIWDEPSAAIFNPSIILFGLLSLAGAYLLQRELKPRAFSLLLALVGLGAVGVGLFPENTVLVNGFPVVHGVSALTTFVLGGAAAITSYRVTRPPFRYLSVILGASSLIALTLLLTGSHLGLGLGGMERMVVYPTIAWTFGFGGYLMNSTD